MCLFVSLNFIISANTSMHTSKHKVVWLAIIKEWYSIQTLQLSEKTCRQRLYTWTTRSQDPRYHHCNNYVFCNADRRFVDVHYQLVPYLLTTGSHAMETNTSSITPLAKHNSFIEKVHTCRRRVNHVCKRYWMYIFKVHNPLHTNSCTLGCVCIMANVEVPVQPANMHLCTPRFL